MLLDCWEQAIQIASQFEKDRMVDTIRVVARRMREIGRFEDAGRNMENIGFY